jgi:NAD(P)-dependent dehydrogenase (short-subunit alcohol dehydrogenase family)
MSGGRLDGRRVLVLGASAGIGRVIGQRLCAAGAHVAFAARRGDVCEQAAKEADGVAIGLSCDVTDEEQCKKVIQDTVDGLGRLDDVVYSTGAITLVALAEADADWWRGAFETNVMGASLITKAALPYLKESRGAVIYLSSIASIGAVWPGLGVYTATKAALNRMVETWRSEHPEIGFTRIFVGPTGDSATGTQFDMSAMEHMARWPALGVQSGELCTPNCIADGVELVLNSPSRVLDISVVPKDPPLPWAFDTGAALA